MNLQPIFDIPEICSRLGIKHAVISPGSRNGALTIAFSRYPDIKCFSVPDERSAGFIALGMSLQDNQPTVLICTSGSAGLNYGPAVAEAFFNRIPLLILTADRPADLIGIRDGQTIYQKELFGKHVKAFFDLPVDSLNISHQQISKAIEITKNGVAGPVHVNIPFKEPFYPSPNHQHSISNQIQIEKNTTESPVDIFPKNEILRFKKVLIVFGQQSFNLDLIDFFKSKVKTKFACLGDVTANLHEVDDVVRHHDFYIESSNKDLQPELVITFGLSVLSKKLKQLLRSTEGLEHWHVGIEGDSADTFGKLTRTFRIDILSFLRELCELDHFDNYYKENWFKSELKTRTNLSIFNQEYAEPLAYQQVLYAIPDFVDVHLANSMTVRYASMLGLSQKNLRVYCNRGTSGIDGSNSTAIGSAISSSKATVLLTGDVSFLYDRNAFWHNHVPKNMLIIVFNNSGGGIFRLIEGPSNQPELEEFFETQQNSSSLHLANEFGFEYQQIRNEDELSLACHMIQNFKSGKHIIEVFTNKYTNEKSFKEMVKIIAPK
ncbi:2-succinyl-5-enolpyruvyl-6-hydroxy-3-cyclohexene-1-carboxylic-acid synthase [Reichenbachiella versicolor]|uniref:2-succinyl-5-enolpyruvyl-6-hydroxy-3- cyclohexene-1-carboxylic-acid synthase n=1 Tax=Reichenbachiella versicolor TaxID=1821036 RepID=UPI000D6DE964|nr:2-succinyl-5-enolpyruvyl-6-hydroxy-3-cyclohexene-1-carboxylic-acid synthase [Reichenbachiella versicolor]